MNPPNNHNSFYGDPNIDNMRSYHPFSPNYPENRRNSSPYHTSTPKHMYDSNIPLNLSCRSSDSSYDYPSPHSNHSPGFPGKFRLSRNHSYSFHNSSNFNDSASRRSFSPSFNYRNNKKVFSNKKRRSPPYSLREKTFHSNSSWCSLSSSSFSDSSFKNTPHTFTNTDNSYKLHNNTNTPLHCSSNHSFNHRSINKRNSSPPFNVEDYCSPEMLEDPWAHLVSSSPSKSSSGPVE